MPSAETSNQAVNHAAAQVIQILAGAVKLRDGNPEHLWLAVQMGEIMSPVFATHAILATVVPPVLLSAAMEMLEHLDPTRQQFVSASVWENITTDDPRIQQHPLKDKARAIFVSRPVPSTSAAGVTKPVPGPVSIFVAGLLKPSTKTTKPDNATGQRSLCLEALCSVVVQNRVG
ncbi:hypothetical protein EDB19DRAFT_2012278 [Suillus lakei]|nr:hypothetical protein EDB19DRAFT_2012278 [Suillus lakei]